MATNEVPSFYFPRGKPKPTDMGAERNTASNVASIIGNGTLEINNELGKNLLESLV